MNCSCLIIRLVALWVCALMKPSLSRTSVNKHQNRTRTLSDPLDKSRNGCFTTHSEPAPVNPAGETRIITLSRVSNLLMMDRDAEENQEEFLSLISHININILASFMSTTSILSATGSISTSYSKTFIGRLEFTITLQIN